MLRAVYLYNCGLNEKSHPEMYEEHDEFGNINICDRGLVNLAKNFISKIHVCYGPSYSGSIRVRNYAPSRIECSRSTSLSSPQMQEFESYLPKNRKVEWVSKPKKKSKIFK